LSTGSVGITVIPVKTISFKVTDEEARAIRQEAKRRRLTVSEFLRRRAAGTESPCAAVGKVRCEFTGAEIFAPLEGSRPLTSEQVREMLADFP
jgi:hypothetical protein